MKASISRRLREVRQELFGEHGGPELARRLSLPARTWYNYETGVTVPAEVLLAFIDQTGANPFWLLSGDGERYRREADVSVLSDLSPIQLIRRGLEKLEQQPSEIVVVSPDNLPSDSKSDFVAVSLISLESLVAKPIENSSVLGHILAYRDWLPHPSETVAVRLNDESMFPILPSGSVVAVDRSITDPQKLQGKMVAANPDGVPMIRWLEITGRHIILRPNQPSREHSLIPMEYDESTPTPIIGQVVWSWSCFSFNEE